jgi:hypothetical protein
MLPNFLIPEVVVRKSGAGPEVELGSSAGTTLLVTLGITRIIEQESLDVVIRGSADKVEWIEKPLLAFPQKFYCGTYTLMLDLSGQPEIKYLRIEYRMNRWGRGEPTPLFGFYVFAKESSEAMKRAVA